MKFRYTAYKLFFTADFETSTAEWKVERARVWLWDICDTNYKHITGRTLDEFMNLISKYNKCLFSFHNLSYDGIYILYYLLEHGFTFSKVQKLKPMEFTTIITPELQHYAYTIKFANGNEVTINDSLKHNSQSVRTLAQVYNLPILKGEIDYNLYRPEDYEPTEEEISYIHNDTEIVMRVLKEDIEHGFTKFTESGNSRKFFKSSHKNEYDTLFPELTDEEDAFIRKSYRGGYCYLNPLYFNKELTKMKSFDINSMYPAQMLHKPLPYGEPIYFRGKAEESDEYKNLTKMYSEIVYIQHMTFSFALKKNKVPVIAKKAFKNFSLKSLYIDNSNFKICELWLTSVDLCMIKECYNIWGITYIDGYLFTAKSGTQVDEETAKHLTVDDIITLDGQGSLYYDYLLPWRRQKEHSKGAERARAKKMQNIGYGWQATAKTGLLAEPYLNDYGLLSFSRYEGEPRKGGYLPIATFITAYSREYIVTQILKNFDRFVYCDTDSLYLLGDDLPDIPIHPTLYGYFKVEHSIKRAKFLGPKRYIYETDDNEINGDDKNKLIVKCCGAPDGVTKQMNFNNFVPNATFDGKISARIVEGGKHLLETTYKLVF